MIGKDIKRKLIEIADNFNELSDLIKDGETEDQAEGPQLIVIPKGQEPPWLVDARKYIDIIKDEAIDEAKVIALVESAGLTLPNGSATPWCAGAVNGWLARAGIKGTGTLKASDFANWGRVVKKDIPGVIKVHRSHVGVGAGNGQQIGGNVSDCVCLCDDSWFGEIIAMVWPEDYEFPVDEGLPSPRRYG